MCIRKHEPEDHPPAAEETELGTQRHKRIMEMEIPNRPVAGAVLQNYIILLVYDNLQKIEFTFSFFIIPF
jgi:hypothetical protein